MKQWNMLPCYGLLGHCTVRYCAKDGLERRQMPPRVPGLRDVNNCLNTSTAMLPSSMERNRLYLTDLVYENAAQECREI